MRIAAQAGWDIEPDSDSFRSFCEQLAHAQRDTLKVSASRNRGDFSALPSSPTVVGAFERRATLAKPGEALLDLFSKYEQQALSQARKAPETLAQERTTIRLLAQWVGDERSAKSITKSDVREFRDALLGVPVKWTSRTVYSSLTLREAAIKARSDALPSRTSRTVSREISAVSTLFGWMVSEGYVDDNPTIGLAPKFDKDAGKYPPFNSGQLTTIFSGPLYAGFIADGREHVPGDRRIRDWRFWVPLIGLFTGARLGEITQLMCVDVQSKHDIWFFDITDESDDGNEKSLKRDSSRRVVPIHSRLIEAGLLEYVEARRTVGGRLFPELHVHHAPDVSKFWRRHLKGIGVKKSNDDGFGFHSFRHTFVDECREAGVLDAVIGTLVGHAKAGMTAHYGQKTEANLKQRRDAIEMVKFEGVNFAFY